MLVDSAAAAAAVMTAGDLPRGTLRFAWSWREGARNLAAAAAAAAMMY